MAFRDTHPKSLRQEFGLPNFVDRDIIDVDYTLRVLETFKILGLNIVYIYSTAPSINGRNFRCFSVDKIIKLLSSWSGVRYAEIVLTNSGVTIEDRGNCVNSKDLTWSFDSFSISPNLTLRYNK